MERTAEVLRAEIAEDERRHTEPSDSVDLPQTLYVGMDGTGIPMRREELGGRAGKQPDGWAKTREVKLCTVWSGESRNPHGVPVRDEGSRHLFGRHRCCVSARRRRKRAALSAS